MIKAIETKGLGKKYVISHEKEAMIRHILPRFLSIKNYEEFWALQDVTVTINKGECVAIIGRNGAGKSTLLNILAGITFPTKGSVSLSGGVSAILSLGAGFHPELTGQENIYLNGAILGLKVREIKKRFKDIVEFSELGDFISAPLQTYSSGMYMRLGFAVAVNVDFDILLLDEILAVGDIAFQNKCLEKLREFREAGKTIVMISQSLGLLGELCDRLLLLDKGRVLLEGSPQEVTSFYREFMAQTLELPFQRKPAEEQTAAQEIQGASRVPLDGWGTKVGTKQVEITEVNLLNAKGIETKIFNTGEDMKVDVSYLVKRQIEDPHFGVAIFKEDGTYCYGPNTRFDGIRIDKLKEGRGQFSIEYKGLNLLPGKYRISVAIWERQEKFAYDYHNAFYEFTVVSDKKDHGIIFLEHKWSWKLP